MTGFTRRLCLLVSLSALMLFSATVSVFAQAAPPRPPYRPPPNPTPGRTPETARTSGEILRRSQQKDLWLRLAIAAYADSPQRLSEAEAYFNNVLVIDGKEFSAVIGLANVLAITSRYDRAIEMYQQAITLKPKSLAARIGLGNAYSSKRQFDKAIEQYKKAIELQPKLIEAHYNLGTVYYMQDNKDGVLQEAEILMKLDVKLAEKLKSLVNEEIRK